MNAGEWKSWPNEKPESTDRYLVRKGEVVAMLYYDSKTEEWSLKSEQYFELNEFQRTFMVLNQARFLWLKPA